MVGAMVINKDAEGWQESKAAVTPQYLEIVDKRPNAHLIALVEKVSRPKNPKILGSKNPIAGTFSLRVALPPRDTS